MAKSKSKSVPEGNATEVEGSMQDWKCESDAAALQRAADIQADPKRMKAVQAWAQERLDEINKMTKLGQ